ELFSGFQRLLGAFQSSHRNGKKEEPISSLFPAVPDQRASCTSSIHPLEESPGRVSEWSRRSTNWLMRCWFTPLPIRASKIFVGSALIFGSPVRYSLKPEAAAARASRVR